MKLVSLTVENFRSIEAARKIPISQITTLIGPNNEGKSNILRALAIGMNSLVHRRLATSTVAGRRRHLTPSSRRRFRESHFYNYNSDYPLHLQSTASKKTSNITLEFALSQGEIGEFRSEIGSQLNGTLPIAFSFDDEGFKVSIAKPGRGHKVLNSKTARIIEFIGRRIHLQYIPAVRTADAAQAIVEDLVADELSKIESDPRYIQALDDIAALQQPVLDALSESITETMKAFLPRIASVRLLVGSHDRNVALRSIPSIFVNDGVDTMLEYKGDGAQSLAAVAIMRHASQTSHHDKEIIIALEEPESHLHPSAIRELRGVLLDLAVRHQVVLSTHNPIFTNREHVESNIIVHKNKAISARSVKDVRTVLGVRMEDNLSSAEVVLLVEGEEDKLAIASILSSRSVRIQKALQAGRIVVEGLNGAGNLTHRSRLYTERLCKVHAFLDDDEAGRQSVQRAVGEGVMTNADVNLSFCDGKKEAELEDLYLDDVYHDIVMHEAGIELHRREPGRQRKWTDRLRSALRSAGKPFDDASILPIKYKVAATARERGWAALHPEKTLPLESLSNSLERKLGD